MHQQSLYKLGFLSPKSLIRNSEAVNLDVSGHTRVFVEKRCKAVKEPTRGLAAPQSGRVGGGEVSEERWLKR
jgi:hypothetical protein